MQDCLTLRTGHPLSVRLQKLQIPVFPEVHRTALGMLNSLAYHNQDSFACNLQTSAQIRLSKSEHFTGLTGISHVIQGQEARLQKMETESGISSGNKAATLFTLQGSMLCWCPIQSSLPEHWVFKFFHMLGGK